MSVSNSQSLITIFGGSGFVGRHVARAFAKRGYRIRVAVRRPDLAGHLQPIGGVGQIHAVQANLRNEDSVRRAVEGSDCVVNLVGVLYGRGKQTFEAVHAEGAANVARAASDAGVHSLIHMSALGADPKGDSEYARSKAHGEEAVRRDFANAVIFRPSVIFGPEDDFFNRFAALARLSPMLPLIGGGHTLFQPVYVGDVAEAMVGAAEGQAKVGETYELGGLAVLSFKEIMEMVMNFTDRKCALIPVPYWMAKFEAFFLQMLPSPLLTVDQVRLLEHDNKVSDQAVAEGRTLSALGVGRPQAIETIVPHYLSRFRPKGQFSVARG